MEFRLTHRGRSYGEEWEGGHSVGMTTLTLPEEFVLLLHKPNGTYYVTADYSSAAEVGELVLRHRIELEDKQVRVLDAEPSGVEWADELIARVTEKAGQEDKPVNVAAILGDRRSALKDHRAALVEHGLLTHQPKKFLGIIPSDRYYPDEAAHEALLSEIREAARTERELDNRLALLCSLVYVSGLVHSLKFDKSERAVLKSISEGEALGGAVEEVVAAASVAIATMATVITVSASTSSN